MEIDVLKLVFDFIIKIVSICAVMYFCKRVFDKAENSNKSSIKAKTDLVDLELSYDEIKEKQQK